MRHLSVLLVVFAASLLANPTARGAALDKREIEARADFAAGRYQKAIDRFAELFAETADPVFLRNIGRCYQKLRRPQEAIDSFNEYLNKAKDLSPAERKEIEGYVKEMEALRASREPAAPAAPPAPPAAPALATPLAPAPVAAAPAPLAPAPADVPEAAPASPASVGSAPAVGLSSVAPAPANDGRAWRVTGLVTAAAGLALVGTGLAFGASAESAGKSVSAQYDPGKESDGKLFEKLQWVGYGVGAAALTTGLFLYWRGLDRGGPAPENGLRARATLDGRGGALLLQGNF